MSFPSIGRTPDDQIKALEIAVAALSASLNIVFDGLNELEGRRPG